uniref:Uncharacterized protein n=1 Tax=Arundo donax TaxID=35708 RepID=A0A0A8Z158_ARUDO
MQHILPFFNGAIETLSKDDGPIHCSFSGDNFQ